MYRQVMENFYARTNMHILVSLGSKHSGYTAVKRRNKNSTTDDLCGELNKNTACVCIICTD